MIDDGFDPAGRSPGAAGDKQVMKRMRVGKQMRCRREFDAGSWVSDINLRAAVVSFFGDAANSPCEITKAKIS
ncbi:MAG TPA: hypothetical protein VGX24_17465 [Pyrinomonadaceae bacterium]|nr:hypothetical protein [Pyrinomonadaceae bacterium]